MYRLAWAALDRIEYAVWAARLRVADWLHGPEPPTEADQIRGRDRDRLHKAFPNLDPALRIRKTARR
jgi:hypothetical protein